MTTDSFQDDLKNYSDNLDEDFNKIKKYLDNLLFSTNLNIPTIKNIETTNNSLSLSNKKNKNTINVKLSKQNSKINQPEKNIQKENIPISHFQSTLNEFDKEDHFNDINKRLDKYNSQIEKFKKAIFNIIKKQGNLKEVEKQIKTYENTKQKDAE